MAKANEPDQYKIKRRRVIYKNAGNQTAYQLGADIAFLLEQLGTIEHERDVGKLATVRKRYGWYF